MNIDIMVDLETMGTRPNAPIIAIGACVVGAPEKSFYTVVSLESAVASGAVMDLNTVLWWMQQSDTARSLFSAPAQLRSATLEDALVQFEAWLLRMADEGSSNETTPDICVWGNGAPFDNVILAESFRRVKRDTPWHFWNDRCYRTVKAMFRDRVPEAPFEGTQHNALDDAVHQAKYLRRVFKFMDQDTRL